LIIVELCKGCVEFDEKHVVDARMANIVTDRGDEKCHGLERSEQFCNWRLVERLWWRVGADGIGR
jgi:hypothetical protein